MASTASTLSYISLLPHWEVSTEPSAPPSRLLGIQIFTGAGAGMAGIARARETRHSAATTFNILLKSRGVSKARWLLGIVHNIRRILFNKFIRIKNQNIRVSVVLQNVTQHNQDTNERPYLSFTPPAARVSRCRMPHKLN